MKQGEPARPPPFTPQHPACLQGGNSRADDRQIDDGLKEQAGMEGRAKNHFAVYFLVSSCLLSLKNVTILGIDVTAVIRVIVAIIF